MGTTLKSEKQRKLFEAISKCGELISACGKEGVSANIVGSFAVRRYSYHGEEDQLDMGDGTNHIHIDWSKVTRVSTCNFHGEEVLIFFNGKKELFKLYNPVGQYSKEVKKLMGNLL